MLVINEEVLKAITSGNWRDDLRGRLGFDGQNGYMFMDKDGNVYRGDTHLSSLTERQLSNFSEMIRAQLHQEIAVSIQDLSPLSRDWEKIGNLEMPSMPPEGVKIDGFQITLRNSVKVWIYEFTRMVSGKEITSIGLQAEKSRGFVTASEYQSGPVENSKLCRLLNEIRNEHTDQVSKSS